MEIPKDKEFDVNNILNSKDNKQTKIQQISSILNTTYDKVYKWFIKDNNINSQDLTDEQIEYMRNIYWNQDLSWTERMNILSEYVGKSERTVRYWCSNKLGIKKEEPIETDQITLAKEKDFNKEKKYFLISCAQNATNVNNKLLKNMEAYAEFINGEILIIPIRYHNPTSILTNNDKNQEWWDSKIVKYLSLKRHKLNNNITVLSDIKTQPTAQAPLTGFENIVETSAIVAHPRIHLKSLPVLGDNPKVLLTTGICTEPNYTDSKAGKIGEFHHTYGFVIVEVEDDDTYYIRQVTADTKTSNFNDLFYSINNGIVSEINEIEAIVKGDIHYGNHDETVLNKSFNELIPLLNPKHVVLHDVFDGESVNHHEEKNFVKQYLNNKVNKDCLYTEVNNLISWLETIKQHNIVIVYSNHNDFIDRYIINGDFKKNIKNSLAYMEYAQILLENKAKNGLLAYIISQKIPEIKCLGRDDSFKVCGWELAVHGMDGVNGSRGSIEQFKKLNSRLITAHNHGIARINGAVQVGTNSKLKLGYNHGMSSWVHSDVIIHTDKKVQHIIYIGKNKNYTTFKKS